MKPFSATEQFCCKTAKLILFEKVPAMMGAGGIKDGKTIMLLQYAQINKLVE